MFKKWRNTSIQSTECLQKPWHCPSGNSTPQHKMPNSLAKKDFVLLGNRTDNRFLHHFTLIFDHMLVSGSFSRNSSRNYLIMMKMYVVHIIQLRTRLSVCKLVSLLGNQLGGGFIERRRNKSLQKKMIVSLRWELLQHPKHGVQKSKKQRVLENYNKNIFRPWYIIRYCSWWR